MPQATYSHTTSRRVFLAATAAFAAIPGAPLTAFEPVDPPQLAPSTDWSAFDGEIKFFREQFCIIEGDIEDAEKIMAQWESRNPFPEGPYASPEEASAISTRETIWGDRRVVAWRQCGLLSARRQKHLNKKRYDEMVARIAEAPTPTLADLKAKASLARRLGWNAAISTSILRHLETVEGV